MTATARTARVEPEAVTKLRELVKRHREEARRQKNRAELWEIRYRRLWGDLQRVERSYNEAISRLASISDLSAEESP